MSLQLLTAIDDICEQFEECQQTSPSARLEEFVPVSWGGEDRAQLIHQLLKIDLEYRARRGESSSREELTTRFADLPQVVESAIRETSKIKPPISGEVFLQRLKDSRILSRKALQKVPFAHGNNTSGFELAQKLVRKDVLTPFQAEEICHDRGKSLLLGNYVLLERLGAGGMGQVFKARHQRMDRIVALKLLPPELSENPAVIQRFQREVRAVAKLTHPNIIAAYDADEAPGGLPFLAMEYVAGCDLAQLLIAEPHLPVGRVLNYILQAARGLAFAHSQGVIHRDIKPGNLLLDAAGTVKILDLGLARIHEVEVQAAKDGLSRSGDVMGTVDYMAPEQALDSHAADARADLYGLGCTLYRLVTGKPLFEGESVVQKLLFHQSKPVPSLRAARPDASAEVEAMFQRMVAKRVEDRFQCMEELIVVLEPLADQSPAPGKAKPISAAVPVQGSLAATGTQDLKETLLLANQAEATSRVFNRIAEAEQSEQTLPNLSRPAAPVWPRRRNLIAAGTGGLLLILFAVWVVIKDKDGKELARVKVPENARAEITELVEPPEQKPPTIPQTSGDAPAPAIAPFDVAQAQAHQAAWAKHLGTQVETANSVGVKMILIPSGEFLMGSSEDQLSLALKMAAELGEYPETLDRIQKQERPQQKAIIHKPFFMSSTEITVGQFAKFVDSTKFITDAERFGFGESHLKSVSNEINKDQKKLSWRMPGDATQEDYPVVQITQHDAIAFCDWL